MHLLTAFLALMLAASAAAADIGPKDVAARVADEPIDLGDLLEGASSVALVGREHADAQPGTRERLLERLVVARLLYLDGRDRHLDRRQAYRDDLQATADPILAGRYLEEMRRRRCAGGGGGLVREEIVARKGLDEQGVRREYERHRANFTLPAQRKVQQIVVRSREEAEEIRALLQTPPAGTTFYTVARDRSIVPGAAQTLGVVGWVSRTEGHPALSDAAFDLAPGEISTPIETEGGFHLIRVVEARAEETLPLDDQLRTRIRARWNANRTAEYAARLAATNYPVTLFPETYQQAAATTRCPARSAGPDRGDLLACRASWCSGCSRSRPV